MLAAKLFHRFAAALMNVRSPCVAVLVLGIVNEMVDSDRSERVGMIMMMMMTMMMMLIVMKVIIIIIIITTTIMPTEKTHV